jgi:Na+/H+ antiporter NhaD/arsenite permease-like protein
MSAVIATASFALAFFFIATEKVNKVKVVLITAGAMAVLGLVPGAEVFFSEHAGIDWNVIFLLLGMMVIVGVIKQTGLFDYLGIWAAKRSRGRPYRLMVMLMVITAVASPFLDNVTTIMLVVPVTIVVCNRLHIPAQPYLIAEILASNIGGAATLIGDPPNIIIASRAGLTFNDFLVHLAPLSAVLTVILIALCRVLFRKAFVYDEERAGEIMAMDERDAIRDRPLLVQGLLVLALVVAGFVLHPVLHYEPSVVALLGAGLLVAISSVQTDEVLRDVEWPTLAFFAGLFIMIGGLIGTGVIGEVSKALAGVIGGDELGGSMLLLGGSAALSAVVDNIPYVATMAPITGDLVQQMGGGSDHVMWWALTLGADLGGNATAIGASANVVVLGIAERSGQPISFWHFTKYGLVVTVATVIPSGIYLWLRYFVVG